MLKSGNYKNIIVMTGAGIGNASGIPDLHTITPILISKANDI